MSKRLFDDPRHRRRRRHRRLMGVLGLAMALPALFFLSGAWRHTRTALLPAPPRFVPAATLNSVAGMRAAFYVTWDPAAYSSLRTYLHQLDVLYPEWLHVITPDGRIQGASDQGKLFDIVQGGAVHSPDDQQRAIMPLLKAQKAALQVLPLVNNFDPTRERWIRNIEPFLNHAEARAAFRSQVMQFLAAGSYKGLALDLEGFPRSAQPGFRRLVAELHADLAARGMKLHVAVPPNNSDFDYAFLARNSDALILMNYDEHFEEGRPGPVASQAWFIRNLAEAQKVVPRDKLICGIGSYGYDWTRAAGKRDATRGNSIDLREAWATAAAFKARVAFHPRALNPYFVYRDKQGGLHEVWFLDAVTALNQMRAALNLGVNSFALWRLGSEDASLWAVYDFPGEVGAAQRVSFIPASQHVGLRTLTLDVSTGMVTGETMVTLPGP